MTAGMHENWDVVSCILEYGNRGDVSGVGIRMIAVATDGPLTPISVSEKAKGFQRKCSAENAFISILV
ncbi:MAG: hypothetical protein NT178_08755 [Proteobacteria bacterium]|nr:hypothetical protein [Pseudomonadota bacterium]